MWSPGQRELDSTDFRTPNDSEGKNRRKLDTERLNCDLVLKSCERPDHGPEALKPAGVNFHSKNLTLLALKDAMCGARVRFAKSSTDCLAMLSVIGPRFHRGRLRTDERHRTKAGLHAYQAGTNGSGSSGNRCTTTNGIRMPSSFAAA